MVKSFGIYAAHLTGSAFPQQLTINIAAVILIAAMSFLNMLGAHGFQPDRNGFSRFKTFDFDGTVCRRPVVLRIRPIRAPLPVPDAKSFWGGIGVTFSLMPDTGSYYKCSGRCQKSAADNSSGHLHDAAYRHGAVLRAGFVVLHYVDMHQLISNPNVAVATAAKELLGTAGFGLIYLTIFIAYATGINATYFSIFRISRALAEDKELPAFYHQKFCASARKETFSQRYSSFWQPYFLTSMQ